MAIIVEHEKRKRKILEKALDVFVEEGYEDVTFQKIADRCGITRTTLYIYFKNKREIFLWSIKQLVSGIETTIMQIVNNTSFNTEKCFRKMLMSIVQRFAPVFDTASKIGHRSEKARHAARHQTAAHHDDAAHPRDEIGRV